MKSCEKGRSMIEMLGVLAIVGVLSVGGIKGYSKAMAKIKTDKVITQLNEIILNTRIAFVNDKDYANISPSLLIKINAVPTSMYDANNTGSNAIIKHALSGEVKIFTSKDLHGNDRAFEIYATGLDAETCSLMAVLDWGITTQGGLEAMYIGTQEITSPLLIDVHTPSDSIPENGIFTPGMNDDSLPINVSTAQNLCACNSTNDCVVGLKYI